MLPGVCTILRKLPPNALPNSGSLPVKQRSASEPSSGPSWRLILPKLTALYRGGGSARRGEGIVSYLPPAQAGNWFLHVLVACSRARRNSRSAAAAFCVSGVSDGIRPLGGSTIF